jgi:hypothetical protein
MKTETKLYPAQIIYRANERGDHWTGRLLNPNAIDTQTGKRASEYACFVIQERPNGSCTTMSTGGFRGGERYRNYASLREAQIAGIRWAARRFKVEG